MYVSIVDYGTGNLNSVSKALEVAAEQISKKINTKISNKPKDILDSDKIILPGQGSYRQCALGVKNIKGLWDSLNQFVLIKKKPIFGICVGMQVLAEKGFEFGTHSGLNLIPGSEVIELPAPMPKPHVGWNSIEICKPHPILRNLESGADFYFVHSYF